MDEAEESYQLRPYGLLLAKLGNGEVAQKACDALELYMRKHKRAIVADDDGLHFDQGINSPKVVNASVNLNFSRFIAIAVRMLASLERARTLLFAPPAIPK